MPDRGQVSLDAAVPTNRSAPENASLPSDFALVDQVGVYSKVGKRAIDFLLSLFGLILLSPLLLIISGLIKLNSPGPVLFRQHRVGKDGKLFRILKFRSMVNGAQHIGNGIATANDGRVTTLGSFLRKWKLDELPQLWNVLKGDMSLVGPRPELPSYVAEYTDEQKGVLKAKPGITDPASLRYRHEGLALQRSSDPERVYRERILPDKLSLSLQYVRNISFARDLSLLLSTLKSVVKSSDTNE